MSKRILAQPVSPSMRTKATCSKESVSTSVDGVPFFQPAFRFWLLVFLFGTAFGFRVYHIADLPLEFHSTRQYRSALIARDYYYRTSSDVPEQKQHVASLAREKEGILEPPIMESLACVAYHLYGVERLWIPRLFSVICWMIGGVFLYILTKSVLSSDAALLSTAYYLFLPFGVVASRSFQPDPLMVMLMIIGLVGIVRYHQRPSSAALIMSVCASAVAIFVKPVCLFPLFGAFVSLSFWRLGLRKCLTCLAIPAFLVGAFLPAAGYYFRGFVTGGAIKSQALGSFLPEIIPHLEFWDRWRGQIDNVFGQTAMVVAWLGVLVLPRSLPRALLVGLWSGCLLLGLAYPYHIRSHDYYQLPSIPVMALSLSVVGSMFLAGLIGVPGRRLGQVVAALSVVLMIGSGLNKAYEKIAKRDNRSFVRLLEEIGERVEHSASTIFISKGYGKPLQYHGQLAGVNWPSRNEMAKRRLQGRSQPGAAERFASMTRDRPADYFIITGFKEFQGQRDLVRFLTRNFRKFAQEKWYLIFDLRN